MLTVLILNCRRPVSTSRIVELVWGTDAPERGVNLVQKYVSGLRRALQGVAELSWTDAGYVLAPDGTVDVERFEALLAAGRTARTAGDPAAAAAALAEAVALWRGPLAQGVGGPGLEPLRLRLTESWLAAKEDLFDAELELGRLPDRLSELRRLTAEHPLRERFRAQLVLALARAGRPAEALAEHDRARRRLADEHGLDPGPHLRAAQEQVLRMTSDAPDPARPAAPPDPAPAGLTPAQLPPAQLPPPQRVFVGRTALAARLAELLVPTGPPPLVCLEGTAGVGKSALALRAAHRAAGLFPDGQLFADLHGFGRGLPADPSEVLGGFLRALGVPAERLPRELGERIGLYRSILAGRAVLVVLDDARDADQIRPLLPGGHRCAVLVTGRRRMISLTVREDAHRLVVPVLPDEESRELVGSLLGPDQGRDGAAVDRIVALCSGLPLALRIVAANAAHRADLPLARIARELARDRVAAISVPDEAQTALDCSIGLSYDLLPPDDRELFCLLGLVPGPDFTVRAAAAMAGRGPAATERGMRDLEVANLLERAADRYRFPHELLRLFAQERAHREVPAARRDEASHRLLGHYLAAVLRAEGRGLPGPDVPGSDVPGPELDADLETTDLEREFDNLTAAVLHAAIAGPYPPVWQLADALRTFCKQRARTAQWCRLAEAGLTAARRAGDRRAEAAMLLNLSDAEHNSALVEEGAEHARQALALGRELGLDRIEASALDQLGRAAWIRGTLKAARTLLTAAVDVHARTGDRLGLATSLSALGRTEFDAGRAEEAYRHCTQVLRLARTIGATAVETMALVELGVLHSALGRPENAVRSLRAALALGRDGGHRRAEALALARLSLLRADGDRPQRALTDAQGALHVAQAHGDHWIEAECLNATAATALATGDTDTAAARHRAALALATRLGYRRAELQALLGLAETALRRGDTPRAADYAGRVRAAATDLGHLPLAAEALRIEGRLRTAPGAVPGPAPADREHLGC
ncbi:BTAD domain-containing putative transcriptional regulator [Kitasatospora saccharophila]|uniref:BTAD domain-containing putative transcriptional regulator n=1 Tax=Kitasatospora saccharophila TaxID=407973 RepID=A0ABP5IY45_9ACTN